MNRSTVDRLEQARGLWAGSQQRWNLRAAQQPAATSSVRVFAVSSVLAGLLPGGEL